MKRPPLVEHRPIRPKSDYQIAHLLRQTARDPVPAPKHPYEDARESNSRLGFAEWVLREHGLLVTRGEIDFVDGKYATPLRKVQEANRVLKRMGLEQIAGVREAWV